MFKNIFIFAVTLLVTSSLFALPRGITPENYNNQQEPLLTVDNTELINSNLITMFVTNHGNFGRDLSGFFSRDYGTWFPVTDTSDIRNNTNNTALHTPLYSAGLWIGGKVNGETRVTVSEYSSEYVPGPWSSLSLQWGDTVWIDSPEYRVYKLFSDSLSDNPNQDYNEYLQYAVGQGAPVDNEGKPVIYGDQTLWSVYNDGDPDQHNNIRTDPLGVEVQQTTYGYPFTFIDTAYTIASELNVTSPTYTQIEVSVKLVDPNLFTGHSYEVIIDTNSVTGPVWNLKDVTLDIMKLTDQTNFSGDENSPIVDGYQIFVTRDSSKFSGFASFEVVSNASGVLDPPESAGASWAGFPTPTGVDPNGVPTDGQQVGDGKWLFTVQNNDSTYQSFLDRILLYGYEYIIADYYYEMRFTENGSYAMALFEYPNPIIQVPFELWQVGKNDPSQNVRLIPYIYDSDENGIYNLSNWGTYNDHAVSDGIDDPYTDPIYWILPSDDSPGESGYQDYVNQLDLINMTAGTYEMEFTRLFYRSVLVNWDGGVAPPFTQELPESGTIFRIKTSKDINPESFFFTQTMTPHVSINQEGSTCYIKYQLYNRSNNYIEDMYISLWSDPDLGYASDDYVGCDTLSDLFFCYNAASYDNNYGYNPPALGFKILKGPIVPGTSSDTADFNGSLLPGYKNLGMTAHAKYVNGTDPDDEFQTYNYMQGLQRDGTPYYFNGFQTNYQLSGDPVTGVGDIDANPADRRMMASMGPFNMNPGDSQYVFVKMAAAYSTLHEHEINVLKSILNAPAPAEDAQLRSFLTPNPQYMLFKKAITPMTGRILFGYDRDYGVGTNIDYASLVLNNSVSLDSVVLGANNPGFIGQTALLYFNVTDFLNTYGNFLDSTVESFTLTGTYIDGSPLLYTGSVTLVGHRTGDFNLDGVVDIADLVLWVDYAFKNGAPPAETLVLDFDDDNSVDIGDLILMVDYMF